MLILCHLKLFLITKLCTTCMIARIIGCNYLYLEIEKLKCSSLFSRGFYVVFHFYA